MPTCTLRSKTGCLTCVVRKRKCDERRPVCGDCHRLCIKCVPRGKVGQKKDWRRLIGLSTTNLRGQAWALSDGHERFRDEAERKLAMECPLVLSSFISRVAGDEYRDLTFLTSAAVRDVWVRQAVIAFSAAFQPVDHYGTNEICLRNYHACTQNIRKHLSKHSDAWEVNNLIISLTLLGILEVLNFGDPVSIVALFSICGDVLVQQLRLQNWLLDRTVTKLYRIAAECIIFNAATMGLYLPKKYGLSRMWNNLLVELFPDGVTTYSGSSPFLGGFHEIYRLMLRITSIFREQRSFGDIEQEYDSIMSELELLDQMVPMYYEFYKMDLRSIRLYQGKHHLHICMMRTLMELVARPKTDINQDQVNIYLRKALSILEEYDLREDNNPGICWPLIVLACTVSEENDFCFTISKVDEIHAIIDPANKARWAAIRQRLVKSRYHPETCSANAESGNLLDYLISLNYPIPRSSSNNDKILALAN